MKQNIFLRIIPINKLVPKLLLTFWSFMAHIGPKENSLSYIFMKKVNEFSSLFGHNIISNSHIRLLLYYWSSFPLAQYGPKKNQRVKNKHIQITIVYLFTKTFYMLFFIIFKYVYQRLFIIRKNYVHIILQLFICYFFFFWL